MGGHPWAAVPEHPPTLWLSLLPPGSQQAHFAGILAFPDSPAPGNCGRSHTLQRQRLAGGRKMELSTDALKVGA